MLEHDAINVKNISWKTYCAVGIEGNLFSNELMHKSEVQQGQQWTTTIEGICKNTSCGGDLNGVV
jgi:hypothetical protein